MSKTVAVSALALGAALAASPALAAVCAVPSEVVQRTLELEQKVKAQIIKSKTLLITEEMRQRELLLAALKVVTRQESGSGQQTSTVTAKSTEAAAATNVAQRQAYQVADAKERYGVIGYNSCELQAKGQTFYAANKAMAGKARSYSSGTYFKPGEFGSPRAWSAMATGGSNFDAESLFTGNSGAAREYINFVAGPPVEKVSASGAAGQLEVLDKNKRDVRRSVAVEVLSSIAAEYEKGGPREKLAELTKHWTADDGGEKWAAATADKPMRAALLDAVRIEAVNIALMAYQVKDSARTELALGALALARVNTVIFGGSGGGSENEIIEQRASLK